MLGTSRGSLDSGVPSRSILYCMCTMALPFSALLVSSSVGVPLLQF